MKAVIYIVLAQGFEEVEGLTTADILRRAKLPVKLVGIDSKQITGSHGITVCCDIEIRDIVSTRDIEAIVLPGGMPGTNNLEKSEKLQELIDYAYNNNRLIGAICAAPIILGHRGLLNGRKAICFPGFENDLYGALLSDDFVCRDGSIITAKGMGVSVEFGLEIAKYFIGEINENKLRESLQCLKTIVI
jgi:protein deglycase